MSARYQRHLSGTTGPARNCLMVSRLWSLYSEATMSRLASLAVLLAVAAPAQLPPNHPQVRPEANRTRAVKLTEEFHKDAPAVTGAPVKRQNLIDEHVFGKMERDRVPHAPLAGDEEFFRRVHLDLIGHLPEPADLRAFVASSDPAKRERLIDALVGSKAWRAKWTYWFGDLAMTAANRVGGEGKNLFYRWVYDNLQVNRPYDEFVSDLFTPNAVSNWFVGPANYLARWVVIGVTCEDTVHEDTADELAVQASKHFLGVNLDCVSCHDGIRHTDKINLWLTRHKREQLWQMAAFFGGTRILRRVEVATTQDEYSIDDRGPGYDAAARSVVRIPRRGTGKVEPVFLTGEKGDPTKPLRPQFAQMLTKHPQFARATVNRFWAEFMGAGFVDPVEDFDLDRQDPAKPPPAPWTIQPTHPELLEALAADFRTNGHNLQRLMKLITKSSAYQLSSRWPAGTEWKEAYARYNARKLVRRLKAEEVYDSIVGATNQFIEVPIRGTDFRARWATELRTPEDFKQNLPGFRDASFFMDVFGQNNREYGGRKMEPEITQAILMMNSPFVLRRMKAQPGSFAAALKSRVTSENELVTELFERFLVRRPEARELAFAKDLLKTNPEKGLEDLQWLLVNKLEFLFNY